MSFTEIILGLTLIGILYVAYKLWLKTDDLESSKKSQSVTYGKISEQFMPFMKTFPYDYKVFKFIGQPVDGVAFCDDKIVFVEFKTNKSKLSPKQESIKKLVEEGKVEWKTITLK